MDDMTAYRLLPLLLLAFAALPRPADAAHAIVNRVYTDETTVNPDGTTLQTIHLERSTANPADAQSLTRWTIDYDSAQSSVELVEAYTLHPDGTRRAVDPSAVLDASPPVAAGEAKFIMSVARKVILFPAVAAGDTVVITYRVRLLQAAIPGQFTHVFPLSPQQDWTDARVVIHVPPGMTLQSRMVRLDAAAPEAGGGGTTYAWHGSRVTNGAELAVSSFADYDALAHALAAVVLPKQAVTPAIQALADQVTAGIAEPRAQARALHDWVTRNILYEAIELGTGALVPHAADAVLALRYGDCKDHVTLFGALLRAKGIDSRPVLINQGAPVYDAPEPPATFWASHMITYLPAFDLYDDTTAQFSTFGVPPLQEYGKAVLQLAAASGAPQHVPVLAPDAMHARLRTEARLGADGRITGESVTEADGALARELRVAVRPALKRGTRAWVRDRLRAAGTPGGGTLDVGDMALADSTRISARFALRPDARIMQGAAFQPPFGVAILPLAGNFLGGAIDQADGAPLACWSGTLADERVLHLPPGKRPDALPQDVAIAEGPLQYHAAWRLEGDAVVARRDTVQRFDGPVCDGALRQQVIRTLRAIHAAQQQTIRLVDTADQEAAKSP
jgi:transglutaminase-like putative cysteine protease